MTPERWSQIELLFLEIIETAPEHRSVRLDEIGREDAELRREVESLLAHDHPSERLVEFSTLSDRDGGWNDGPSPDMAGRRIGSYMIVRLIGYGGMGAVYLGVRADAQYDKRVAIKLLKRGMDTDFMLGRFKQERQILANLDHPFIARLLDGGATDEGLPYFVMEHVEGVPVTKYCAEKNLTVPERVRLFQQLCEAVQHAHQNLVVHRDIKPSNILVTKEGIPKLLDFGIAKVIHEGAPEASTLTQSGHRLMTPEYASPEQVEGGRISTATDVYSLGAVLYEMLSGQRPYRVPSGALVDLASAVRTKTPEKPSVAAAKDERLSSAARKQLARRLTGDLDNIVLTAMRKEPQRRYGSAAELSDDLRRHLEGLPVLARDDRWTYRAGKFIQRHKIGVAAAALIVASLIGGIIATAFQARRAERRFQIVRQLANSMLFELHDEMERLPGSTALRAATIRTVAKYLDALAEDGSTDPGLELEIAQAYERVAGLEGHPFQSNLGRGDAALASYRKAITLYERLAVMPAFRTQAIRGLIDTHLLSSQLTALMGDPGASDTHFRRASDIAGAAFADPGSQLPKGTQIHIYNRLADAEYQRGDATAEQANCLKALQIAKEWAASDQSVEAASQLLDAYRLVGSAQARAGELVDARESYRQAVRVAEPLLRRPDAKTEYRYSALSTYASLGDVLAAPDDPNFGERAGAAAAYQKSLRLAEDLATADPRNRNGQRSEVSCYWRLAMILSDERPAEALEYSRKGLKIAQELSDGDPQNSEYRYHLSRIHLWMGAALRKLGRHDEAVQSLNRAVEFQNSIAAVSPERIWNLRVLSRAYVVMGGAWQDAGNDEQALAALRQGLTTADLMLQRAPGSLSHQIDRADALEAIGMYHSNVARRSRIRASARDAARREARLSFQESLRIWEAWTKRKTAEPYSSRRQSRVAAMLAAMPR